MNQDYLHMWNTDQIREGFKSMSTKIFSIVFCKQEKEKKELSMILNKRYLENLRAIGQSFEIEKSSCEEDSRKMANYIYLIGKKTTSLEDLIVTQS